MSARAGSVRGYQADWYPYRDPMILPKRSKSWFNPSHGVVFGVPDFDELLTPS